MEITVADEDLWLALVGRGFDGGMGFRGSQRAFLGNQWGWTGRGPGVGGMMREVCG